MRISGRRLLVACVIGCASVVLGVAVWGAFAAGGDGEPSVAATDAGIGTTVPMTGQATGRAVPGSKGVGGRSARSGSAQRRRTLAALAVLRAWDRSRARAWAEGDPRALRRLYVDGSAAGRRDGVMLRRWVARGLRVRGMSMQVLGVRLRVDTGGRLVLVVRDRLVGAYAVGHGRRYALPADNASTRRLAFRRVDGRWLLALVASAA